MLNFKHLFYFRTVAKTGAVNRAAEKLHLTPQTLSGQISAFEARLGTALFRRDGRRLELTDAGRMALTYADEIFQVGAELEDALLHRTGAVRPPFRVGVADAVPKGIAHQLIAPALALPEPARLVCTENRLERLVADLAIHRLDMVLADRPLPPNTDVRGYSHLLGECGVGFFAAPALAATLQAPFPQCLDATPLLLPGEESALRAPLLRWLERQEIAPVIVGEFDDSALLQAFGNAGAGVFPLPLTRETAAALPPGITLLGETQEVRERFFAISVERRLRHPAVVAISEAARLTLLGRAPAQASLSRAPSS
jgi:LysR family transcriptional activator of nhaA